MPVQTYKPKNTANNQNTYAQIEPPKQDWGDTSPLSTIAPNWGEKERNPYANNAQHRTTQYTPKAPSPWTPKAPTVPTPTAPATPTATPWGEVKNSAGEPLQTKNFNTQALRDQYTAYMQATLPYNQFLQNQFQYNQDFTEAARRWDTQNAWQQSMDRYNMDLTGRKQTMAEWQQQEAAKQWAAQFGHQQANDAFSQGLANRQFDWQQSNDLFNQGLANRQFDWGKEKDLFQQGLANRQFGLEEQKLGQQKWYQQQQVQLAGQAQAIEQAYNEGRLSNEQRSIALGELKQQQDNAFRQLQLAEQLAWAREQQQNTLGFSREELAATQAYRQQQDALARAQMAQQLQMQQAQIEATRRNAILQATGRNSGQAPNVNWMRRF